MKIRISSRWMLLLLHQLTWSQVIQAFAGAQSGWGRMHFLGHADGNPYASASVPWQYLSFPSLFLEAPRCWSRFSLFAA